VVLTWYLEDMCRVELDALSVSAEEAVISAEDAAARATWAGGIVERMWAYLTDGDPEL
jgi:HCOMODA/2-hydroxy-3-carboxy-muconic semialdehyde decarboxylase